jgi:hypothetical protein
MAEEYAIAVGVVPSRDDGMLSLHVGPSWTLLKPDEACALACSLTTMAHSVPTTWPYPETSRGDPLAS